MTVNTPVSLHHPLRFSFRRLSENSNLNAGLYIVQRSNIQVYGSKATLFTSMSHPMLVFTSLLHYFLVVDVYNKSYSQLRNS